MNKNILKSTIDYRNARYEGFVTHQGLRHQAGILIDDDLSFYVSQWDNNKLDGNTLVYIQHGKYIYGTWHQNQPHGLNVFRSGDTVLIGFFQSGLIQGKILVIFQRYNIIALLAKSKNSDTFSVINCGKLISHDELLKYIDMLEIKMPQNYFSLIKYVETFVQEKQNKNLDNSNNQIIVQPCKLNHCYFGYKQGLGIVFNSNNGVVSVGNHQKMQLVGYGGKFKGRKVQEGNFQLGETICYNSQRPTHQIYSIFHKMHKRSLTFKNQYFDSKVKTLKSFQNILRQNIQKIVNFSIKNKGESLNAYDLNDSLDYQSAQNLPETEEAYLDNKSQTRQNIYYNETYPQAAQNNKAQSQLKIESSRKARKQTNQMYSPSVKSKNDQSHQFKKRNIYFAKKSPLNKQNQSRTSLKKQRQRENKTPIKKQMLYKQNYNKSPVNKQQSDKHISPKKKKNLYIQVKQKRNEQRVSKSTVKRNTNELYKMPRYSQASLPGQFQLQNNSQQKFVQTKNVPKFNGLEQSDNRNTNYSFQKMQNRSNTHNLGKKQTTHKNSCVQEYRRQLQKSRSIDKQKGQSISKVLKRPNYQDIQQRRKKIVQQFKGLNSQNNNMYNNDNAFKALDSPYQKQKIMISQTSQNQGSVESSMMLIPLSLVKRQCQILKQSINTNLLNRANDKNKHSYMQEKINFRKQNPQNRQNIKVFEAQRQEKSNQIKPKLHYVQNNLTQNLTRQKKNTVLTSKQSSQFSYDQKRKAYKYYFD